MRSHPGRRISGFGEWRESRGTCVTAVDLIGEWSRYEARHQSARALLARRLLNRRRLSSSSSLHTIAHTIVSDNPVVIPYHRRQWNVKFQETTGNKRESKLTGSCSDRGAV